MSKPTPLSGFPELLPAHRHVEREVIASLSRTFELHGFANIETRAVEPLDRLRQGWRDRQGGLRPAPPARRGRGGGLRARAALRPDRPLRALRARARRQARVPVPAVPDPAGVAWRASPGGPLPRVHPGRHRRGGPRQARLPPRRRGGAGDGGGTRRPSRCRTCPFQVNNRKLIQGFYRGLGIPEVTTAIKVIDKLDKLPAGHGRGPARRPGRCHPRAGAALPGPGHDQGRGHLLRRAGARPRRTRRAAGGGPDRAGGGGRGLCLRGERARAAGGQPADRPRPGLLHRHGPGDLHGRLREPEVRRRRWPLRRARQRRPDDLSGGGRLLRGLPHPGPAALRRCPRRRPLGAQRRPGRPDRRGVARRQHRGRPAAAPSRCGVRGRPQPAEVRQADPLRRASRHPLRLVPPGRRRPRGEGHPVAASRSPRIPRPGCPRPPT